MNQVALRRLIGGSVLVWVVCTVMLMTHPVPPQQRVGAQAAPTVPPTASATAEGVPEQLARPVYLPLIQRGGGIPNPPPQIRPSLPSDAIYVEESWGRPLMQSEEAIWGPSVEVFPGDEQRMVTIDGQERSIAFGQGYNIDVGQTLPQGVGVPKYIILAFGNQDKINNAWGVNLPRPVAGRRPNAWILQVAQDFFDGYAANPAHTVPVVIGIGTSNAQAAQEWACDNSDQTNVDARYEEAGEVWADLIFQTQERRNTVKVGANDIEAWTEFLPDWSACGAGMINWMEGFRDTHNFTLVNFGNNPYNENDVQWTRAQTFLLSGGFSDTVILPQVYCNNESFVRSWTEFRAVYELTFQGVTSTNGFFH